jgi:hypothetical protein
MWSMDADGRRERKRSFKEREKSSARQAMLLEENQLKQLLEHLDERLSEAACDHSLRLTLQWAKANAVESKSLVTSLEQLGGYCDCEVFANVEPESIF